MATEQLQLAVDEYINNLIVDSNRSSSSRLKSPRPALDIDGFFRLVGETVARQQELEGVTKTIEFYEEFPEKDDNIGDKEVLVFSLKERMPGTVEQTGVGSALSDKRQRTRHALYQEALPDPENPGAKIFVSSHYYDNLVEFTVFGPTNKVVNRRAMWLEDFFEAWRWYFRASGIVEVHYQGRGADITKAPENRKLCSRSLYYYVRTEKITQVREYMLRRLVIDGSLNKE